MTSPAVRDQSQAPRKGLSAVSISYGGRTLRFATDDPRLRFRVLPPHTAFVAEEGTGVDCEVAVRMGAVDTPAGAPDFAAADVWELRRRAGAEDVTFYGADGATGRAPFMQLVVHEGIRRVDVVRAPIGLDDGQMTIGFPLDEYVASRVLGRAGGLVLHAAALEADGGAYLFAGYSGAGKSTISALAESEGATVLSDDRTIVTSSGGAPEAWGTPWHGTHRRGSPRRATVRGIFLLRQAPADRVVRLDGARAFKELLVRLVQPTADAVELGAAVDAVHALVRAVPVAELHFRPTPAAFALAVRAVAS